MRKIYFLFFIAITSLLVSFSYANNWMKYNSEAGHYSISFPGKPEESSEDQKNEDSVSFKIHFATYSPSDNEVFMVGWINMSDFYPKGKSMKEILESSRDGATESMKAKNVTTLSTNLGDEPYIEFTFSTSDFTGKDRICVINKFQYSIITIFSLKTGITANADKFITSFKYVK